MKSGSTITLALALALGGGAIAVSPVLAAKEKAPAAKYTPAVQNAVAAAQKAVQAKDTATAKAELDKAKAAAKTDDDKYIIGAVTVQNAQAANDQAGIKEGVDMMLASGKAPADQQGTLLVAQGKMAYQAKNFPAAEQAFTQAQAAGSTDPDLTALLVETKAQNGKTLEALQVLNAGIDKQVASGQPVPNEWFGRGINIGYAVKKGAPGYAEIAAATTDLTKKWVAAYPTKSNWRDTLVIYRDMSALPADQELDMYRLLRTIGGLKGERDYMDYVEASYLRFPAEAKGVLDEAVAANQINLANNRGANDVMNIVKPKLAADKASLPAAAKGAQAAANGRAALSTGDAYLGYGEWQQAVDMYKLALAKGGVDADTANLRMGMALARLNQKDAAKAAFGAVKGPRAQLASYWMVYLDHPVTA